MPIVERNKIVAVRKAENIAFRYLSEQEISHRVKFLSPRTQHDKKDLTVFSLELRVHGEIRNEYAGETAINMFARIQKNGRCT